MGSLSLRVPGPIYVDAQILIYTVEAHVDYGPLLRPLWTAMTAGQVTASTSALSWLEVLVPSVRHGDLSRQANYRHMLDGTQLTVSPITTAVLEEAARLRATHHALRTPDAIHVATALTLSCGTFLTNDRRLRSVSGLPITILDDVLSAP